MNKRYIQAYIALTLGMSLNVRSYQIYAQDNGENASNKYSYITGQLDTYDDMDSVTLFCTGQFYYYPEASFQIESEANLRLTSKPKHGKFSFKIPSPGGPFHITLYTSSKREPIFYNIAADPKLHYFLLDVNDSINIDIKKDSLNFSGKGFELFLLQYAIKTQEKSMRTTSIDFNEYPQKWLTREDSILKNNLNILYKYKTKISPLSYSILKADIIGKNRMWVYERIEYASFNTKVSWGKGALALFEDLINRKDTFDISGSSLLSPAYIEYQYQKLLVDYKYKNHLVSLPAIDINLFPFISSDYSGPLEDKLLTRWLKSMTRLASAHPEYFKDVLSVIKTPIYRNIVEVWQKTYAKGETVVNFSFKDSLGNNVRLNDYKGKVICMDMWFTECLSCIDVSRAMIKVEEAFRDNPEVVFLSVSIDREKKKWLNSIGMNTPDDNRHAHHFSTSSTIYLYTGGNGFDDEFIKKYVPGTYPHLLIIDKQGKIFSSDPPRPDFDDGQEKLIDEIKKALKES